MSPQQRRRMYSHHEPDIDDNDLLPIVGILLAIVLAWSLVVHFVDWLTFDFIKWWAEPLTILPFGFFLVMFEKFGSTNPLTWWPLVWGYKVALPEYGKIHIGHDESMVLAHHGGRMNVHVIDHEHIKFRKKHDAVMFLLKQF